jgi:type I restriction-modification system DNA methylase subunit
MIWIAPIEKDTATDKLEKRLRDSADEFRANSGHLCRMSLAVHDLEGNIRHIGQVNSHYDDPQGATGRSDFVLANPPFNVNAEN